MTDKTVETLRAREEALAQSLIDMAAAVGAKLREADAYLEEITSSRVVQGGVLTQARKLRNEIDELEKQTQSLQSGIYQHFQLKANNDGHS